MSAINQCTTQRAKQSISSRAGMAARQWSKVQREAQSAAIRTWEPWQHSTGARTSAGKAIISRNAYRGSTRPICRFTRWFYRAIEHPETLTPEIVESAKHRCITLLSGNAGYMAASITKLIAKHKFSETEVTDLQELARAHEDIKSNLKQCEEISASASAR